MGWLKIHLVGWLAGWEVKMGSDLTGSKPVVSFAGGMSKWVESTGLLAVRSEPTLTYHPASQLTRWTLS